MSASRPKGKKVIPKPRGVAALAAQIPQSSRSGKATPGAEMSGLSARGTARRSLGEAKAPAKGKGSRAVSPISIASSPPAAQDDDDDDLEEVPLPLSTGVSSPYPGTPVSNVTRETTTAPGSVDYNSGEEGEEGDESEEDDDDGVIHLELGGETAEEKAKRVAFAMRKKPMTARDRAARLEIHKVHVIALLASASIRNRWCNNNLLKARLLSLLPHPLQAAFNIPPSRFPDRAQRSRLFFDALQTLATWWSQTFFDVSDPTIGLRTRPWDEVQEIVDESPKNITSSMSPKARSNLSQDKEKGKADQADEELLERFAQSSGAERLRSVNSLMKKALQQEGSRDVSAQLFVALARACGLGARLVTSLQAVPFRAEKVTQRNKPSGAGQGGKTLASRQGLGDEEDEDEEDDFEEVPIPGVGNGASPSNGTKQTTRGAGKRRFKDPTDLYRLRKYKPQPQKVGTPAKAKRTKKDLSEQPPVFWAEIFSRSDQRWIPVDPVRGIIRKKNHYEPSVESAPVRMLYVVAFEEDGYARDVTLRYTRNFYAKTSKLRVPTKPGEPDWWGTTVIGILQRPYRLVRDELEDAELETSQISEGMPMHMSGFKDHPIYVLERHLKREQILKSGPPVGRFKGEAVYRRASVVNCKTAENWMRSGRRVREGQEPLKWVKMRAVTLQKRRAQELAKQEGEEMTQGLYAEYQTELYRPPPIQDGIVPRNAFGNIDLYAPTMLPAGAVHLSYKGIAKVAKGLGISYAEACTGFEFKKQRAVPTIDGIVVAKENEQLTLDAYKESAAAAEEKERIKREEQALRRWVKLVNGLRLRLRLQQEYGTGNGATGEASNPLGEDVPEAASAFKLGGKTAAEVLAATHHQNTEAWETRVGMQDGRESEEELEESDLHDAVDRQPNRYTEEEVAVVSDDIGTAKDVETSDIPVNVAGPESASRPKIILRFSTRSLQTAASDQEPELKSNGNARKRKAPASELPAASDPGTQKVIPTRRGEGKKAIAPAPTAAVSTRSLRSRAPKTKEQEEEEMRKRERMVEALESDGEEE